MVSMNSCCFMIFIVLSITGLSTCDDEKNTKIKKKLQIGVKKRVENCQVKSKKGDFLHMHYTGTLEDGTEFDSSYNRGQPLTFTLGSGQVIRGWDQGLMG
ncbi:Peptidyl-prolyl cis-trans isomerase FKBP2 [Blattella germanica]|nr:Peptidyl-prolyl cis-trans isomerase FKBP2 [Blattella germanica]